MDAEFLKNRADRINRLLDSAERMGDGAASLGTLIMVAATDDEYDRFMAGDLSALNSVEARFNEAGIRTV